MTPLDAAILPPGIRARFIEGINGLTMHVLEAGFETPNRPCVLLLHGFPEIAYSWRKVMPALAAAGYHVVAPDQRGYGRTTGWNPDYDGDLRPFSLLNLVRDSLGLVHALGYRSVAAVVGHDFGASGAAWCGLVRPDVFRKVVLMSAPFAGPPSIPFAGEKPQSAEDVHAAMAKLDRPRKHYQWYYSTRPANDDMWHCKQGVHAFMRAYFHHKSADWTANKPHRLGSWSAPELTKMPTYYIMDLHDDMAATVAKEMPAGEAAWLTDAELRVYSDEYARNGFQGGLQWYRCRIDGVAASELQVFAGRTIDVPSMFISGKSDWGVYQVPGVFERMQGGSCTNMVGAHLLEGAGHWVQQEQPEQVNKLLLDFLK